MNRKFLFGGGAVALLILAGGGAFLYGGHVGAKPEDAGAQAACFTCHGMDGQGDGATIDHVEADAHGRGACRGERLGFDKRDSSRRLVAALEV